MGSFYDAVTRFQTLEIRAKRLRKKLSDVINESVQLGEDMARTMLTHGADRVFFLLDYEPHSVELSDDGIIIKRMAHPNDFALDLSHEAEGVGSVPAFVSGLGNHETLSDATIDAMAAHAATFDVLSEEEGE